MKRMHIFYLKKHKKLEKNRILYKEVTRYEIVISIKVSA